jgi:trk system potassium uptake protein TrkH
MSSIHAKNDLPLARRAGDGSPSIIGWLLPLWMLSIGFGVLLLRSVGSTRGNELPADRAIFAAVNAATLTGFSGAGTETLQPAGRVVILLLTLVGAAFAFIAGGCLVSRAVGFNYSEGRIARATLVALALVLLGGTPMFASTSVGLAEAAQLAVGSFANCGIAWGNASAATSWRAMLILLPLAVLGGLSMPVLLNVLDALRGRDAIHPYTDVVARTTAGAYLIGTLLIAAIGLASGERGGAAALAAASAVSIDARSLGMAIAPPLVWPAAVAWVAILLMLVGAAPGSAGGGLGVTTIPLLHAGLRRAFAGEPSGRPFGIAVVWIAIYLAAALLVTVALVASAPQVPGDRLAFMAVSALGTVGLSHDPVSVVGAPLHALTLAMLFGRLAPLAVLWWVARGATSERITRNRSDV